MTNSVGSLLSYPATVPTDLPGIQTVLQTITRIRLNDQVLWQALTGQTANIQANTVLANGTTATTQSAGDNSTKVATTAYVDGNTVGGANQSWQDVTVSRAIGSAYTNSTGRPIQVMITYTSLSGTYTILNLIVGGTTFGRTEATTGTVTNNASFIVPAGSTYEISLYSGSNPATIQWSELR